MPAVRAALLDIDGVLTVSWVALPGAVEALDRMRTAGLPTVMLTNTTSRTRASIAAGLTEAGFDVTEELVLTAPALTAAYLQAEHPGAVCLLLNSGDIAADLAGVNTVRAEVADSTDAVDVVLVGGAGPEFSYRAVNTAFAHLQRGARLVAMHRNLSWATEGGLQLDGGAFLLGLERAAGVEAVVVGKPAPAFFETALAQVGVSPPEAVMVGDDVESDVLAAQRVGIGGVLVRTGKYSDRLHAQAARRADHVLDSVADLPDLLELP